MDEITCPLDTYIRADKWPVGGNTDCFSVHSQSRLFFNLYSEVFKTQSMQYFNIKCGAVEIGLCI